MAINMGMGKLGSSGVIHKRKFRWTFHVDRGEPGKNVPASFVKVAARPNLNVEETEINFLNAKRFIPGKGTWETVSITYYDIAIDGAAGDGGDNRGLWSWIADVYDYTGYGTGEGGPEGLVNPNPNVRQSSRRDCYNGTGVLILYDGCGNALEKWNLIDCWPQAVNFGELDYSQSEEVTIEVTLRYGGVTYDSFCPSFKPVTECCGCSTGTGGDTGALGV
jgi:hypothetical protein